MAQFGQPCVAVVGAGAAGLAAAIFIRRTRPAARVVLLEGAAKPGAKILVSGGGRCNVTNTVVADTDFWGGKRTVIRRVLQGFPVGETIAFFDEIGVPLHEEAGGKLFPDSNRARDVLHALLAAAGAAGVELLAPVRVVAVERVDAGFVVRTGSGSVTAATVVLATGGRSLPKTGSDGTGYELARALGHSLVPQTPALAPLVLDPDTASSIHVGLSGVAIEAELSVWVSGALTTRQSGALLWTHFGISGPAVLNV